MNLTELETSWQQILDTTAMLEQSAAEEEWGQVSTLAVARHQAITEHFNHYPVGPESAAFYYEHLSGFIKKEEHLQKLAFEARKASMKASIKVNTNRKAMGAYRKA